MTFKTPALLTLLCIFSAHAENAGIAMRKFKQNKLCRDKLINILESKGSRLHWRTLDDKEFNE